MKSSVITPLLKKSTLDRNILKNYRPVSGLSFFGKLLERVVAARVHNHLLKNCLYISTQSAYRSGHSVETALLHITDSILCNLNSKNGVIMLLLDLSAAFDTIDHGILVSTVQNYFGIQGKALEWISSYISNRSFQVKVGPSLSKHFNLMYGVPQGSVLGPLFYTMYTSPLAEIISSFGVQFHFYADDTQIWLPVNFDNPISLKTAQRTLELCVESISSWMSNMKLKLNAEKTELLVVRSKFRLDPVPDIEVIVGNTTIKPSSTIRNLGVIFDDTLSFSDHISRTRQSSYFHLRNIKGVQKYLPNDILEGLIHAFVSSKLDFCNSLMHGLPDCHVRRLRNIQNNAARLLTKTKIRENITPVLFRLHWLPVEQRCKFKILILVHRVVYTGLPKYLNVQKKTFSRTTRLSGTLVLEVPMTKQKTLSCRTFTHAAPKLWNELPNQLRSISDHQLFKAALKTHLFTCYFNCKNIST
jgi:hypothetical protein